MSNKLIAGLPIRKQKYLENIAKGMNKKQALIAAGYSSNVSSASIETEDVKQAAKLYFQKKFKLSKITKRINEGMDAVNTEFFSKDGHVTDSRDTIDYSMRVKSAVTGAQLAGYYTPKAEIDHTQRIDEGQLRRLNDIAEKISLASIPAERIRELEQSHVPLIDAEIVDEKQE